MGVFDQVDNSAKTEESSDFVRGQRQEPVPSSIQNLIVKYAYAGEAKSGAIAVHTVVTIADGDHKGREIRSTEYITSGAKKGKKTFYERKDDNGKMTAYKLPGYEAMDTLAKLTTKKSIVDLKTEKKVIKLYDYDKKAEVPTEVDMFVELVGTGVCGCILHQINDKRAKNTQTGEYEPTGKTYAGNIIDKFLDARTRKTLGELNNNSDADYKNKWETKWGGQIDDQSTEVKSAGLKGAPSASGESAEKTDLFG
jgi:hypothetical protein